MKLFEFTKNKVFSFCLNYRRGNKVVYLLFTGLFGSGVIKFNEKSIIKSNEFYLHFSSLKFFKKYLVYIVFGINFFWSVSYEIIGYNYTIKNRLRKKLFRLNLGYSKHKIILNLPFGLKVIAKKRRFWVFSTDIVLLYNLARYIRDLRNLFPYKLKGLVSNSNWKIFLKPGKVTKYR